MNDLRFTPPRKQPRIVILDDESQLVDLLELCIRDWFKDVELVKLKNGDDALRELARQKPDLFIMDWAHPGLDGHEIMDKLADAEGYAVLLTSDMFAKDLEVIVERGLKVGYLPKPFGMFQFWRALNEFIGPSDFPEIQAKLLDPAVI